MRTGRELLALAAEAMRAAHHPHFVNFTVVDDMTVCLELGSRRGAVTSYWKPLTDDGDALHLAVKLNLIIECMKDQSTARTFDSKHGGVCDFPGVSPDGGERAHAPNQYAATRRAIVIAAASIGSALLAAKEEPNV